MQDETSYEPLRGEIVGRQSGPELVAPEARPFLRKHSYARLLIAANVAVYLLMVLRGVSPFSPTIADLDRWGALDAALLFQGQWWRLLTSAFVHIGIVHLALNMWCLWYLAELSETLFGGITTVAVYCLTAMTGGLLSLLWGLWRLSSVHAPFAVSAGASGAIFGLAGAVITSLRIGRHAIPANVRSGISNSALRFAVLNLFFGLLPGIDNAAHLGGMIGGLVLGAGFAGTGSMLDQYDLPARRAAVCAGFAAILFAVLFWLFPHGGHR